MGLGSQCEPISEPPEKMAATHIGLGSIEYPSHFHFGPPLPLRRTSPVVFSKRITSTNRAGSALLDACTSSRDRLCTITGNDQVDPIAAVPPVVSEYLGNLRGLLVTSVEAAEGAEAKFDSPLRSACGKFVWTQWTDGSTGTQVGDVLFDAACSLVSAAICLQRYACARAAKKGEEEDVKLAFRALVIAISYVTFAESLVPSTLGGVAALSPDMQPQAIKFLKQVLTAQAQELTLARAEAVGHALLLVSKLASEAARLYGEASISVPFSAATSSGKKNQLQWKSYLDMKQFFFTAESRVYQAMEMWSDKDKERTPGPAIKCSALGMASLDKAVAAAAVYTKASKVSEPIPQMQSTGRRLKLQADTINRTNNLVHRAPMPAEVPPMPEPQCTIPLSPFAMPPPGQDCTQDAITDLLKFVAPPEAPAAP